MVFTRAMSSQPPLLPFSFTPDPSLLYLTPALQATLHKVRFLVSSRQGLTCIFGDVGLGKSSVLRSLYGEFVSKPDTKAALITSPNYPSDFAFLKAICGEFGLQPRRSLQAQEQELRDFLIRLYQDGKTAVLFVDEAQKMPGRALELVRTLLNFETSQSKLIQIVLAAQLELRDKLKDQSKKAIRSRIFAPSHLTPLTLEETRAMLNFRCEKAGIKNPLTSDSVEFIYTATNGVPRDILKTCHLALELATVNKSPDIPVPLAEIAYREACYEQ